MAVFASLPEAGPRLTINVFFRASEAGDVTSEEPALEPVPAEEMPSLPRRTTRGQKWEYVQTGCHLQVDRCVVIFTNIGAFGHLAPGYPGST